MFDCSDSMPSLYCSGILESNNSVWSPLNKHNPLVSSVSLGQKGGMACLQFGLIINMKVDMLVHVRIMLNSRQLQIRKMNVVFIWHAPTWQRLYFLRWPGGSVWSLWYTPPSSSAVSSLPGIAVAHFYSGGTVDLLMVKTLRLQNFLGYSATHLPLYYYYGVLCQFTQCKYVTKFVLFTFMG